MYKNRLTNTPLAVEARIAKKQSELIALEEQLHELETAVRQLSGEEAEVLVKRHITELKQYNELRDTALALVGLIADSRGVRVADVMQEIGVDDC